METGTQSVFHAIFEGFESFYKIMGAYRNFSERLGGLILEGATRNFAVCYFNKRPSTDHFHRTKPALPVERFLSFDGLIATPKWGKYFPKLFIIGSSKGP